MKSVGNHVFETPYLDTLFSRLHHSPYKNRLITSATNFSQIFSSLFLWFIKRQNPYCWWIHIFTTCAKTLGFILAQNSQTLDHTFWLINLFGLQSLWVLHVYYEIAWFPRIVFFFFFRCGWGIWDRGGGAKNRQLKVKLMFGVLL